MPKKRKNKPGAGRPEVPENKRLKMRYYRMSDDDYEVVEKAGGEKLSEWTRKTLLRAARRRT